MLTAGERIPEIEDGKWCELETKQRHLVDKCEAFTWRDGVYHAGGRIFLFNRAGDGRLIGEYAEIDPETGQAESKLWTKFVVAFDNDDPRMANVGDSEDDFLDFSRVSRHFADARGINLEYDYDFDVWDLYGSPYAMRRFMSDLLDHIDPTNRRYYKLIDDHNSPANYPSQVASIARGTTNAVYVGEYICLSAVNRTKQDQIDPADIPAIKELFRACDDIQRLQPRELSALANLLWTEGNIEEADDHYRKSIAHPGSKDDQRLREDSLLNWAWMHHQNKGYEKSISIFTQLLEENPGHLVARSTRGLGYRLLKDHSKALADYTKTIEFAREVNDELQLGIALMRRGYVHQDDGRLDVGERDVKAALGILPELSYGHSTLGIIEEKRGSISTARKHYNQALEIDPNNVHAKEGIARIQ